MSTIPLLFADNAPESVRDLVARIRERERRVFGHDGLSNVWRAMAHHPPYMQANWERSRAIMQRGEVPPVIKEMVASAISIVNCCHY